MNDRAAQCSAKLVTLNAVRRRRRCKKILRIERGIAVELESVSVKLVCSRLRDDIYYAACV